MILVGCCGIAFCVGIWVGLVCLFWSWVVGFGFGWFEACAGVWFCGCLGMVCGCLDALRFWWMLYGSFLALSCALRFWLGVCWFRGF